MTEVVLIHLFSLTVFSKKLNICHGTQYHGTFIPFKSHFYSEQKSSNILLFGSRSAVCISMFELSQSFSDNSNLIILVDIQRLHDNGICISCVSNRVYVLFKRSFLVAPHCFIKLLLLRQS